MSLPREGHRGMASHRYIGYVGGLAVAVGVGAAVAVSGQGLAHAETESASSASESASGSESSGSVDAGPAKPQAEPDTEADETDDSTEDTSEDKPDKAGADKPSLSQKLRQSAKDFEAEQVEKLRSVFTLRAVEKDADVEPVAKRDSASDDAAADADEEALEDVAAPARLVQEPADESADESVSAAAAAPVPWSPDPFRPDDPDPQDMPGAVLTLRDLLMGAAGPEFRPYIREGVEAVYRGSQIVPWVNVVVPAYKIVPAFIEAAQGNKAGAQVIINELLKTTGPVSLLYYGYDQIADLANMEYEARLLKEQFYSTAWDTLDPLALLHEYGDHGLPG
ncbi:hypothetical protein BST34_11790 [Mycolicibacterium monacense DSM 44395]|nr:hypothetical protein BST34_11790 [Mycolicibacterium monacense DSM 44395]QHP85010.1 hypothetical protein EWR22_06280 [Mycolicibacterium monacense DSM 44395]